jgi:outer membrane protein
VTLTQPIYRGGRTRASTNRAENQVMGERARLIAQEQTTFANVVSAYVNVIQQQQTLQLNINNEQVLARQLQATNDRFRVGEITRTDVAQAEAALAGATATRQTSEGNLATARATFRQVVGVLPPGDLAPPQPLAVPVKSQQEALTIAAGNNPNVVAALFDDASAKDAVDVAYSALMPTASFQGTAASSSGSSQAGLALNSFTVLGSSRRASSWTTRAAPRCSKPRRRGRRWSPRARRPTARAARSVPTGSRLKAWSARRSSAAARRWTC